MFTCCFSEWTYDEKNQSVFFLEAMSNSLLLEKERCRTFVQCPNDDQFFLQLYDESLPLLIVSDWQVTNRVETNGDFWLQQHLLLPNFHPKTMPFMINYA